MGVSRRSLADRDVHGARCVRRALLAGLLLASSSTAGTRALALDPSTLPKVGSHPEGIYYYSTPYLADALANGGQWLEFTGTSWGTPVFPFQNAQFDADGHPLFLNPGTKLRAILYGLHADTPNRPPTWPKRSALASGHVVVAWKGNADVRLPNATFLASESSGAATGRLVDGRRVYVHPAGRSLESLEVWDVDPLAPVRDLHVWLPDPGDREHGSLEGHLFHPLFLARLADAPWGYVRTKDLLGTDASPVTDWSDRRRPSHLFQSGVLHRRSPAPATSWVRGDHSTGLALEHAVALCNQTGLDLWVNVPHLAADDVVTKMAKVIRFGSDGTEPYDAPEASPVFPPLAAGRRVFVEYSNEVWNGGDYFAQGEWAQAQATAQGLTRPVFVARRSCNVWRLFQQVFGGTDRLVRVAAVFTAGQTYTEALLSEMASHGPTLSPPVEPDVVAVATYFGNGIQDWAFEKASTQAGTPDRWFLTADTFDAGGGSLRPVSVPPADPYWTGPDLQRHLGQTFDQWVHRLLSGDAAEGGGPDAVGLGGGFDLYVRDLARTAFPTPKPLVSYEGGPSLYSDSRDGNDPRDDGLTTFLEALNRHARFRDVYRIHLNTALAKGLRSHTAFVDTNAWGRYGQFGHLETLDQAPSASAKWSFLLDWIGEAGGLRHVDDAAGAVPRFADGPDLGVARHGLPFAASAATADGDGTRQVEVLASSLPAGLAVATAAGPGGGASGLSVSGTPSATGRGYVFARVKDADGDPAWRTFLFRAVGAPGTLFESDFRGADPGTRTPWTGTYALDGRLQYSGWRLGSGSIGRAGADAFTWVLLDAPPLEADATLAVSLHRSHHVAVSFQPAPGQTLDLRGARFAVTVRRLDYHAPHRYTVFCSLSGFTEGAALATSSRLADTGEHELEAVLPSTAEYAAVTGPVELRLYGWAGPYGGQRTSLTEAKLLLPAPAATPCLAGPTTLCVDAAPGDGRFRVEVDWSTVQGGGQGGKGQAVSTAPIGFLRGGIFWFFDAANPEMLVKVLDGCAVNGHFWVFGSAGTNVGLTLTVTDTTGGASRSYVNPDLTPALPVQDVTALPCG